MCGIAFPILGHNVGLSMFSTLFFSSGFFGFLILLSIMRVDLGIV